MTDEREPINEHNPSCEVWVGNGPCDCWSARQRPIMMTAAELNEAFKNTMRGVTKDGR